MGIFLVGFLFGFGFGVFLFCCFLSFVCFFFFLIARDQRPLLQLFLLSAGSPVMIQRSQGNVIWEYNSRYSAYEWIYCILKEDCQGNR